MLLLFQWLLDNLMIIFQLKLMELDKGSVQRLFEKDGANMEMNEGNDADVKFIKQALELDLMVCQ